VIGFDTVIVLDNLSTDETRDIALQLAGTLDVRLLSSLDASEDYQKSAYRGALERFGSEFGWMAFFDADEFLVLDGFQSLPEILSAHPDTAAIGVNWAIFGSSGHREKPPGWTLENYRWRSEASFGPNKHVKSIVRPNRVKSVINGHSFEVDGPYRHLSGADMVWHSPGIVAQAPDYRRGKLHHYFVRSWQDWQAKMRRGYPDLSRAENEFEIYDRNEVLDESACGMIANIRANMKRRELTIDGVDVGRNIAINKPALQSSVSEWSFADSKEADAAGAVNGNADGRRKFHTGFEQQPWWQVDLLDNVTINAIRIFNTTDDTAFRFQNFTLSISFDAQEWIEFFRKEDGLIVGGITTTPFIWVGGMPVWGRYVRVTLLGTGFLHLDQVEIYSVERKVRPIPTPALKLFAFEQNPLPGQGFIIGWEAAKLGNRLSSFANLFALSARTGVASAYPQLMSAADVIDLAQKPYLFMSGAFDLTKAETYGRLCRGITTIFDHGFSDYMKKRATIPLSALPELTREKGIIVYASYEPVFHDLIHFENAIKEFCGRGNMLVLAGAFWYQYLDMRIMPSVGHLLKQTLQIGREDQAGGRAALMAAEGQSIIRIGVHMRRGDYKDWYSGQYYFDQAAYVGVLNKIHASLTGQPHRFYLCSDQSINRPQFDNLPICYDNGTTADDFAALAKCHIIVGPPSSFGTWAAFLGGARRLILTPERIARLENWNAPLMDSIKIPFPTGAYLPGDEMGRPL
jgi:hypothetical protein